MANLVTTLLLCFIVGATWANEPNLRLYFNIEPISGYVNLYTKNEDNLYASWAQYLRLEASDSYCWVGLWQVWDKSGDLVLSTEYSEDLSSCAPGIGVVNQFETVRFLGPANSTTEAIALYLPGIEGNAFSGEEHLVEGEADNIPFTTLPTGLITFGYSNWTLFAGKNYTGESRCHQSKTKVESLILDEAFPVQSVIRGCDEVIIKKYTS